MNDKQLIDMMDSHIQEATDLLREAKNQIEYLHQKFQETGSGNAVIEKINILVNKIYNSQFI
jgi:hypothetical protein